MRAKILYITRHTIINRNATKFSMETAALSDRDFFRQTGRTVTMLTTQITKFLDAHQTSCIAVFLASLINVIFKHILQSDVNESPIISMYATPDPKR